MAQTPTTPNRFVWHELNTQDVNASCAFYGELFGWSFDAHGGEYIHISAGDAMVGGMMKAPAPFIPTHWLPYVSVDDVDASMATAKGAGFEVLAGPMDVEGSRFVVLKDPQGAVLSLWHSGKGDGPEVVKPARGSFCWDQLNVPDPDAAFASYSKLFDWTRLRDAAVPAMSTLMRGDRTAASLMQAPPGVPAHWLSYVVVDTLAGARNLATKLGGKVMVESIEVPGMGAFGVLQDPQGASIAVFEDRR